jgi:hypothetical protein
MNAQILDLAPTQERPEHQAWLVGQHYLSGVDEARLCLQAIDGGELDNRCLDWLRSVITNSMGSLTCVWAAQCFREIALAQKVKAV